MELALTALAVVVAVVALNTAANYADQRIRTYATRRRQRQQERQRRAMGIAKDRKHLGL